jgi:hypothetical protein
VWLRWASYIVPASTNPEPGFAIALKELAILQSVQPGFAPVFIVAGEKGKGNSTASGFDCGVTDDIALRVKGGHTAGT